MMMKWIQQLWGETVEVLHANAGKQKKDVFFV